MKEDKKPEITQSIQKGRFFSETKVSNQGNTQTTTVTVNVDQKDDCLTGCFKSITDCFKKSK